MIFALIGTSNPYSSYPAPVIPIGRLNGKLIAVYPGGEKHDEPIDDDADPAPLSNKQIEEFSDFDRLTERLFAIDENRVLRYRADKEVEFFAGLLANPDFSKDFPDMRAILQRVIDGG